jgi:ribonuclease HII
LRWIGIDEAGYGPNLGPLVMTAVVAQATDGGPRADGPAGPIDIWGDLASTVDRAGGDAGRLWVDDSKAILRGGKGRDRLESACLAALHAVGIGLPGSLAELLEAVNAGTPEEAELSPWFDSPGRTATWPWVVPREAVETLLSRQALEPAGGAWRLAAIESVVVGPSGFNAGIETSGSKAEVHFAAFARLLRRAWERAGDGATYVTGDKHGGRHYYLEPLSRALTDAWIDRGPERPESSRYTIRDATRRLELTLVPKADRTDGLVALASIVSKAVRELWMDGFNAYWCARVPGLRPTAGYPVDARRFRRAIEEAAAAEGCHPSRWWRVK